MKRIFTIILLFTGLTAFAQQGPPVLKLTLNDAINYALENNFNQQKLIISKSSAEEELQQSKRDLLPNLSGSLSQGVSNGQNNQGANTSLNGNYSINSQANLYNGGQSRNSIRKNQLLMEQSGTKISQSQNQLAISVIKSFLSVLMNEELRKYQQEVLKISEEQCKLGEVQFSAGKILKSDYMLLEAQLASDRFNYVNSEVKRESALLELKNYLSIDPSKNIEVVAPNSGIYADALPLPELTKFLGETLAWLPDIEISRQNIDMANLDLKIAKGGLTPAISIGGSVSSGYTGGTSSWSSQFGNNLNEQISVSISIPVWNRGKVKSGIKQSQYRREQAEIEAKETEMSIRTQLEQEYNGVVAEQNKFSAAETGYNAYKENFDSYRLQYNEGLITTTDMLQQQNNYLNALSNYLQSKYSFLLNRKVLDVYMGLEIVI
ncbi:MAG: Outer membrane efflux protein [uncultured bacterium]|nr:MAG: Outer membrane efflux protein [uncultured bacterium]HBY01591.1 hypothetical protein [Rikenellaceae bacterium]